jgi:hypothetical protein
MSHGGAVQKGSKRLIRRFDNQAVLLTNSTPEAGASMIYELKNHATGSAAELIARPGTIGRHGDFVSK